MGLKDRIIELRKEGKTYNEIAKCLDCSKSVVSYHCNNIKIINIDDLNLNIITEIIELRKSGKVYSDIYEKLKPKYNITKENVRRVCSKNGLSHLTRLEEVDILEIKNEYVKLKNVKEVAKKLGYTRDTVRNYIEIVTDTDEERKAKATTFVISWRRKTKIKLVEYKGGKCERCDYNKCVEALEFHHLDPKEKDFTVSGKSYSFERLKNEVDKCIMVCSNCHVEIHVELKEQQNRKN